MAERVEAVEKTQSIRSHISFVLRTAGHKVGRVVRVMAPGDVGSYEHMVTAEYLDDKLEPHTALLWTEEKRMKAGVKVAKEKVAVCHGWQDFDGFEGFEEETD